MSKQAIMDATADWVKSNNKEETPLIKINPTNNTEIEIGDLPDGANKSTQENEEGFMNPEGIDDIIPSFHSRIGEDDTQQSTKPDTLNNSTAPTTVVNSLLPQKPGFPFAPGFPNGRDFELGTVGDLESIPDVNVYQHKKTLAQGMMDLALFSANANQLRYVLESSSAHPYFYPSVIMISISLILQVAIGVGLIWNSRYNVKDEKEICIANKVNNYTVIGIFVVTSINVFISAFGVGTTSSPTPTGTPPTNP